MVHFKVPFLNCCLQEDHTGMPGATAVWKPRVGQLLPSLEEATAVAVTVVTIVESGNQGYSQDCVLMLLPCMMQDA